MVKVAQMEEITVRLFGFLKIDFLWRTIMKKTFFIIVVMFLIGGLTIFGLNRLSSVMYGDSNINKKVSPSNVNNNPSSSSDKFNIEEPKPEESFNDGDLEKQNSSGQIYYKNIDDAYKLLGINEVEAIKEKVSLYIKSVLKLTNVEECEVKSINLEGQKIIFNMTVNEENFTVVKNKETGEVIVQVDTDGGD